MDDSPEGTIMFLLHPKPSTITTIKSIILRNTSRNISKQYIVCFVPLVDIICMELMDKEQIRDKITVCNLNFGLIPFHDGLISIELSPHLHDVDVINCSVEALIRLSSLTG